MVWVVLYITNLTQPTCGMRSGVSTQSLKYSVLILFNLCYIWSVIISLLKSIVINFSSVHKIMYKYIDICIYTLIYLYIHWYFDILIFCEVFETVHLGCKLSAIKCQYLINSCMWSIVVFDQYICMWSIVICDQYMYVIKSCMGSVFVCNEYMYVIKSCIHPCGMLVSHHSTNRYQF